MLFIAPCNEEQSLHTKVHGSAVICYQYGPTAKRIDWALKSFLHIFDNKQF